MAVTRPVAKAPASLRHERILAHTFEDLLLSPFLFRVNAQAREILFHYTRLGEAGRCADWRLVANVFS